MRNDGTSGDGMLEIKAIKMNREETYLGTIRVDLASIASDIARFRCEAPVADPRFEIFFHAT